MKGRELGDIQITVPNHHYTLLDISEDAIEITMKLDTNTVGDKVIIHRKDGTTENKA